MVLDIQTVHHILKNTAVQNVNKPFVYITDLASTLTYIAVVFVQLACSVINVLQTYELNCPIQIKN
jgi:hypothetical protein